MSTYCAHCGIYLSGYTVRNVNGLPQIWCVNCNEWAKKLEIEKLKSQVLLIALKRIEKPDFSGVDGMIIVDMGHQHFVEHTAATAIKAYESSSE